MMNYDAAPSDLMLRSCELYCAFTEHEFPLGPWKANKRLFLSSLINLAQAKIRA